jgi:hypothetical protein
VRLLLVQLFQQPSHVTFGLRVVRQISPTVEFLLDVFESFGICHAIAVPDVRHKISAERKSKSYSPGMRRWGTHISMRVMGEPTPQRRVVE